MLHWRARCPRWEEPCACLELTPGRSPTGATALLVHRATSNIRCDHVSAEYFDRRNDHDVAVEDDEIRELARRERARELFLEPGVRGPNRHRLERFLARHRLLGEPSTRRPVVVVLA